MAQSHSNESRSAEMASLKQTKAASLLSLFTSSGTLVCCALPALLVGLGAGAAMSSLISNVPQLVWFSEHKVEVFAFAAMMLLLSGGMQWRARSLPCPADPALAAACMATRKASFRVYIFSVLIFLIGGFFAFIAPLIV
ncbi:MAG TPA: hypothetical protein VK946_05575 [Methylotenera sp.]|nr:hypothetical protein [Methylotenera sp.]